MILFIGSNPSHVADTEATPFCKSTKSGKIFSRWLTEMNPGDEFDLTNIVDFPTEKNKPLRLSDISDSRLQQLILECSKYDKVVALGSFPSHVLAGLHIKHFRLPHPSPRNYQLNNYEFIREKLKECKKYITGERI